MSDEYLWDRTGEPDPEIERLESLLARYRYQAKTPRRFPVRAMLAIAASLMVAVGAAFWMNRKPLSEWQVAGKRIAEGQTIETAGIGAKLESSFVGELRLEPNSRLQILRSRENEQRLSLRRGTMHALIWAPPERFVVDTPSAKTVDLGCAYTLTVLEDGSGLLKVETGWVAFQSGSIESFIPSGAACRTRPQKGPGVPYFEDASEPFRDAVVKFDETRGREGLDAVLADARPRDGLSLWHLALRTSGGDRERVTRKFAELLPAVDAAGLMRGDRAAIDAAWNALDLGRTDWWRTWKRKW
jgi:hypothetical protein